MEVLRCFNCDHTGRRQEDFFNITNIHPSFTGKSKTDVETGPNESLKENTFLVCCDCVYDRLQECHSCSKRAPLCMFKLAEWFTDKKNRNCIDCAAMFEAQELFQTGYHSSVIIRQCLVCRHFKYLPSFIAWSKHKPYETLKDCFECQLRQDIVQYKRKVRDRYERKLQQEPVLGEDKPLTTETGARTEVLSHKGTTYASVVSKGQFDGKSSSSSCENDRVKIPALETIAQLNIPNAIGLNKGKCFSTGLDESFCSKVLGALKISLVQLEEKTKLELQLLQSDPKFWQVALRDKLLRVSQLFSSQATEQIPFNDAESCWAYLGTYTAAHATLVQATVTSGQFEPLTEFIKRRNSKERLYVCCLGAGPGSEILGLHQLLPSNTEWMLLDNCEQWNHTAQVILRDICGVPFRYGAFDICRGRSQSRKRDTELTPNFAFKRAKLFLMVKFVSAVQNLPGAFNYLSDILKRASPGTLFLFVDNAHIQTKTFIEDLVFPSQDSTEQEEYKENKIFRLYTTYAELNSDREEGLKCAALCEWMSLISYWLDRHPILDLRVNIHLAVKKP
ncbi:uncharacterized protein [Montipora capricornis]|uniref:uncharacterized protein n=1 Tax=Montipora capricornis TaxID=246305 RepID=UPI0035F10E4E